VDVMNLCLYRKAYMLEFLENDIPKEVFTFSVPPESEDFDFAQRISETKTFGGSVFDDYGNDTIKITLSGTTINEELKLIYKGNADPKYLTGEKEIYHLQEILEEWGTIEKIPKKKVYLYDLSKMVAISDGGSPSKNYWRVAIKNLKIRRAKDKPRTYLYTLEMIGFKDSKDVPELNFDSAPEILDNIQEALDNVEAVLGYSEAAAPAIDSVAEEIIKTRHAFEELKNAVPSVDSVKKPNIFEKIESNMARINLVAGKIVKTKKAVERLMKADWSSPAAIMKNVAGILDAPLRKITGASVFNITSDLIAATRKLSSLGLSPDGLQRTATIENDERTISFNSGEGTYIAPKKVAYGGLLVRPIDPVMAKHTFLNWYRDQLLSEEFDFDTEISENMTLYAKWTQSVATATFNSRLGTAVPTQNITVGKEVNMPNPAPIRSGFVFEYWCSDAAAENRFLFTTLITKDITLYARWRTVYAVSFISNSGSAVPVQQIEVSDKVIAPMIPTRENYLFVCWCKEAALNNEYDFNSPVNSNLALYAKWTQVSNTITFNSNGGSAVPAQTVMIGRFVTKPANPTKTGYTFIRWCSDAALTNEYIFETTQANTPLTIYAAWVINKYSVTFATSGGSAIPAQEIEYQNKAVYPINPTKAGQLFKRWCTDAELTTEFNFATAISASMTLYAAWVGGQQYD